MDEQLQQVHRLVSAVVAKSDSAENESKFEWTTAAKMAVTKMIMMQCDTLGGDLEAFAKY